MKNTCVILSVFLSLAFFESSICLGQTLPPKHSNDKEANAYYLKALEYIKIGNPRAGGSVDSLVIATQLLEKAVKEDSLFLLAYIELCKTYWLFGFSYPYFRNYNSSAIGILPKAKHAILKALEIDSTSSEAWSQLARMNLNYEYRWDEALKNFSKAIHYDPGEAVNYSYYGETLALKGKWDEAQQWIDRANKMTPEDSQVLLTTGIYYYWKREYRNANKFLNRISPQSWISRFFLSLNFIAEDSSGKAIEMFRIMYPDGEPYDGGSKALLAYALVSNGQAEEGRRLLNQSYELEQVVKYRAAVVYVALKEYDKAFELLNEYILLHGNWMIWLNYDKAWDPIRGDKRFKELLKKMSF